MRSTYRARMQIIRRTILLTFCSLLFAASSGDRFSGTWQSEISGESRTVPVLFEFKVSGSALTGTIELPSRDKSVPITEGKIQGNTITFKGWGTWTGTIGGDDLKLTRELDYGKKQQLTAHRVPS
jgi:hypothetical protein